MRIQRPKDLWCALLCAAVLSFGIGCGASSNGGSSGEDETDTTDQNQNDLGSRDSVGFSFNVMMMNIAFDEDFQLILDSMSSGEQPRAAKLDSALP